MELLIDERLVIHLTAGMERASATLEMKKNRWHRIRIRYSQDTVAETRLRIEWCFAGQPAAIIDGRYLRHSQQQQQAMDIAIR